MGRKKRIGFADLQATHAELDRGELRCPECKRSVSDADGLRFVPALGQTETSLAGSEVSAIEAAAASIQARDPLRAAASEELQRAVEQTAERVERWMEDQRRRLGLGIDAMVASLKEQRETEIARIEEWKAAERARAESQLAEEKERFHAQLMTELVEFEHQLGERLREQEERLLKWWDEAEQLAKQRFADLGFTQSPEAGDSHKA